jgi:hypothetical protein
MPQLYIVRRWGPHKPGSSVTVEDELQARWLLDNHFAEPGKGDGSASAGAVAPGTDGPDPRAGGDVTRRRPVAARKVERRDNQALPVDGAPVQYNAGVRPEDPTQLHPTAWGERRTGGDGGDETAQASSTGDAKPGRKPRKTA